jgi:glycerol-1-phosphate dehydrogenase [NAD(P)+]
MLSIKGLLKKYHLGCQEVRIANNLAANCHNIIADLGFKNKKILLVCDQNIYDNNIQFFAEAFAKIETSSDFKRLIFKADKENKISANQANLAEVLAKARNRDLIIAIGSGTINDLSKLASSNLKIPYIIFASAASMNGYLSANASIMIDGHKKSLSATLPLAVYCDLDILKAAPSDLTKAGIADSLCFYNCYFDAKLSNMILKTDLNEESFTILAGPIDDFMASYQRYSLDNKILLKKLITILLIAGISMTIAKSSYPASQAEHLIAHLLEMKYPSKAGNILHGLQIAVTTMSVSKLQAKILRHPSPPVIAANDFIMQNNVKTQGLERYFTKEVFYHCQKEVASKLITKDNAKKLNLFLRDNWLELSKFLGQIQSKQNDLKKIFKHFKINTSYEIFQITRQQYHDVVKHAKFIRSRFTCLELVQNKFI